MNRSADLDRTQYLSVSTEESPDILPPPGSSPPSPPPDISPPPYSPDKPEEEPLQQFQVEVQQGEVGRHPVASIRRRMPDLDGRSGGGVACICGTIAVSVVAIVAITIACIVDAHHKINEGSVGIYFKYGALMEGVTYPGVHFLQPFVTDVVEIKIRPETDTLYPIAAVTKDGIQNIFKDIQIISRVEADYLIPMVRKFGIDFKQSLVFDRVKEELKIFCANATIDDVYNTRFLDIVGTVKHNTEVSIARLFEVKNSNKTGIQILNLVIPKPEIPEDIANNYKQVKVQWTEQLVATQQQKTEKIKKETESIKAIADAERFKAVLEIKIQEKVLDKQGDQNISTINNQIVKEKEENIANIEKYKIEKQAEANRALYTPEYVKLNMAKALANNTKLYFSGQESVLGGLINEVLGRN